MQLQVFPRPADDTGIGMHFGLDVRQENLDAFVPMIAALRARWIVFYVGDEIQAANCVKAATALGIMPVLRPKCKIGQSVNWPAFVEAALADGAPGAYIQIGNEPGNDSEYQSGHAVHAVFVSWWQKAANAVAAAGGYPGLQTFEIDDVRDCVTGLPAATLERLWFASHAYASNHPPDYPYNRGLTIFQDDTAALMWLEHANFCYQVLGRHVPVIVTEGGYVIDQLEDTTYPRIDADLHARYSAAIFDQFRTGVLAGAAAVLELPDYLFAYCPFLWRDADYMAFAWYLGMNGTLQKTIDAVKAIPAFTRKFSWDAVTPAQTLPQATIAAAQSHTWMPINTGGALYKYAQAVKLTAAEQALIAKEQSVTLVQVQSQVGLGNVQTDEFEYAFGGDTYVGQVFNLGIAYVKKGAWDKCAWVRKPAVA